jgi:hypothetical protein
MGADLLRGVMRYRPAPLSLSIADVSEVDRSVRGLERAEGARSGRVVRAPTNSVASLVVQKPMSYGIGRSSAYRSSAHALSVEASLYASLVAASRQMGRFQSGGGPNPSRPSSRLHDAIANSGNDAQRCCSICFGCSG